MTIATGTVTHHLAKPLREEGRTDVREVKCSEFGSEIIKAMQ